MHYPLTTFGRAVLNAGPNINAPCHCDECTTPTPQPKRVTTPIKYRTAASLTEERDRLVLQRDGLGMTRDDPAMARLGHSHARRENKRMDSQLGKWVELDAKIRNLDNRIYLAESRERKAIRP
jgi:hypothetical protein